MEKTILRFFGACTFLRSHETLAAELFSAAWLSLRKCLTFHLVHLGNARQWLFVPAQADLPTSSSGWGLRWREHQVACLLRCGRGRLTLRCLPCPQQSSP